MENKGYLKHIHPVLPVQNVVAALFFYVNKLGFDILFADDPDEPKYAGIARDGIQIHLQWHDAKEWEVEVDRPMLRIETENVDALFTELNEKEVFHKDTKLMNSQWGTREFGFYDLYKNGLIFYTNLTSTT
ncbi:VOC family protein [Aegicerativicinus sediminis]|uniref:VOC family protein n=1 Tax=Aegicerativicinus sediminis TaxID=2893202 RepID=UPI001E2CC9E6|nr:VOC family protein [Aegicerativicinus sediminis]